MSTILSVMPKIPLAKIAGLVIAAVVGFMLGLVFWNDPQPPQTPPIVSEAEPVIADLEKEIPKNFTDYSVVRTGWTGQSTSGSPITVPGYDFTVSDQSLPGLLVHPRRVNDELVVPAQSIDDVWGFVHEHFAAAGFKSLTSDSYIRGDETCTIMHEFGSVQLELRCRGEKLEKSLAEQAKPFVDLYLRAHAGLKAGDLMYGPMVVRSQNPSGPIGASKIAGYDLAEAVVRHGGDSFVALFYGHQGKWHYITEAYDEFGFSCSDITKDPQARKAFRHQWCYQYENDEGLRKLDLSAPTEVI